MPRSLRASLSLAITGLVACTSSASGPVGPIIAVDGALGARPQRGAIAVEAGSSHACALLVDGSVRCWGENYHGELGDEVIEDRTAPVVVGVRDVIQLAAGDGFTCALTADRAVSCWGRWRQGDDPAADGDRAPTVVPGLADVRQLAAGNSHACALLGTGAIQCWGDNHEGAFGDGTLDSSTTPKPTEPIPAVTAIAAADDSTCAITADGAVYCWGSPPTNEGGEYIRTPQRVPGLARARQIGGGLAHFCALTGDRVACWGWNSGGQLGDGSTTERATPARVALPPDLKIARIAVGYTTSCAVTDRGRVYCWGDNSSGALGGIAMGYSERWRTTPAEVPKLDGIGAISLGVWHGCGVRTDGAVTCWGTARRRAPRRPVLVTGLDGATDVDVNRRGSCAVTGAGGVACWGELSQTDRAVAVPGLRGIEDIASGDDHTCARDATGKAWCWGDEEAFGPDRSMTSTPVAVPGASAALLIVGSTFTCTGSPRSCVGEVPYYVREPLAAAGELDQLAVGAGHACALLAGGEVACWGENRAGMVGTGTASELPVEAPYRLAGITGARQLAAGDHHTCVLSAIGEVACWGSNSVGQLGTGAGAETAVARPSPVPGIAGATQIDAHYDSTCAVAGGAVWCWGENDSGQLGDGTRTDRATPVRVDGIPAAVAVQVSTRHACALTADHRVWCWGTDDSGQLGDGTAFDPWTIALD